MSILIKTTAAATLAAALSTTGFAKASDPDTDIIGMTCGDYLERGCPDAA